LKEHSLDSVPQPTAPPVREEILQQDIFQDVDFEPMVWTGRFSIYPLRIAKMGNHNQNYKVQ
jgi:hypothetical protein